MRSDISSPTFCWRLIRGLASFARRRRRGPGKFFPGSSLCNRARYSPGLSPAVSAGVYRTKAIPGEANPETLKSAWAVRETGPPSLGLCEDGFVRGTSDPVDARLGGSSLWPT